MEDGHATDILDGTYRALCQHGYADLTLRDVAAEADTSKASIHYHYGCKDQLFVALLDSLADQCTERVAAIDGETPRDRLFATLEALLVDDDDAPPRAFRTAMLEVTAQAPYDEAIRERLVDLDEFLFAEFRAIIEAGVAEGQFDERVDPSRAAEFITTAVTGAHTREVGLDRAPDRLHATMLRYAERHLLAADAAEVAP